MYVLASYRTNECEPITLTYYDSESGGPWRNGWRHTHADK